MIFKNCIKECIHIALHPFKFNELSKLLTSVVGKTLGEVDTNNVFKRTLEKPKITGIAGDVIEQSVLGYPADSTSEPDLLVDGIPTELKTTGIRIKEKNGKRVYTAKEPMSVTAVSINHIVTENEFEQSRFWKKLENLLLVYYHYSSSKTVPAAEYANFKIEGFQFHQFSLEDQEILKNDWTIVRDFIRMLQQEYDDPTKEYYRISSELRKHLMLIDTAPKFPNSPRFRLKRPTLDTIVDKHFGDNLERLESSFSSFKEIDLKLNNLTRKYKGKNIQELINIFNIPFQLNKRDDVNKNISEQIIVRMLGGKAKKLSRIELFSKVGLVPKTIVLSPNGARTEDMKLFPIDFDEWARLDYESASGTAPIEFSDSFIYNYFSEHQFICIVFKESSNGDKLLHNEFIGFKRLVFEEEFINTTVKEIWSIIRDLILNNRLKETIVYNKYGNPIINPKTNTLRTTLNFPKSKDYDVFVRGSGIDASNKPMKINGISMYNQYIWIKGSKMVALLNDIDFL